MDQQGGQLTLDHFTIENDQIELKILQQKDAAELYAAIQASLIELRKFPASLIWSLQEPNLEASHAFCLSRMQALLNKENFVYVVRDQDCKKFLGVMDIHEINWEKNSAAVGFWGNAQFKQQGYMCTALKLFAETLMNQWSFQRLEAFVDTENVLARKLCEKVDFKIIEIQQGKVQNPVDGSMRDICRYVLEKK
ncbi:GNAT family N-acetyltransferase [Acinetobacter sp. YH01019]|nr:GNAT family protein [Acinetobacter sp. YH01019]